MSPAHALYFPEQGILSQDRMIGAYNPQAQLFYSVDGGDHYLKSNGDIDLDEIKDPDLKQIPSSFHWKLPAGDFPEVRSVLVKIIHNRRSVYSEPVVLSYLEESHGDLPVICITASQKDLVSDAKGILVFGESAYEDQGFYCNWWNRSANFQRRGSAWEKEIYLQLFEKDKLVFEQQCGIKISGNATRGFPQKSFQLAARSNYGPDKFDFPFLGDDGLKKYKSLVLRNSGNDNSKTMFADLLMHRLSENAHVLTQKGRPSVVYLNGNYWGIYNIRERIDQYMIAQKEDVKEEEVTILENASAELKEGEEKEKGAFDDLMEKVKNALPGDMKCYREIEEKIDLDSFTDYIIFETFFANSDWPANNSMWYKAGNQKWKWILNDLDYGLAYLGAQQVEENLFDKLTHSNSVVSDLFNFLITVPEFKRSFNGRAEEILKNDLSEETIENVFESTKSQYYREIERHVRRWRMIDSMDDWEKNCQANLDFLVNRPAIYKTHLEALK